MPDDALDERVTRMIIRSDPVAVRDALQTLFDTLLLRSLTADDRGTAELVLAEALNNIVEHAYAAAPGVIEVTLHLTRSELTCHIVDTGAPMPGEALPVGNLPSLGAFDDLPEGGFGWSLIRTLSRDLDYRRENGRNLLSFRLEAGQSPP